MEKVEVGALLINRKKLKAGICRRCNKRLQCITGKISISCLIEGVLDYFYGDQPNFVEKYVVHEYKDIFIKAKEEIRKAKTVCEVVEIIEKFNIFPIKQKEDV